MVEFCQTQFNNQLISQKQGTFEVFRVLKVFITDEKHLSFALANYFENVCEESYFRTDLDFSTKQAQTKMAARRSTAGGIICV